MKPNVVRAAQPSKGPLERVALVVAIAGLLGALVTGGKAGPKTMSDDTTSLDKRTERLDRVAQILAGSVVTTTALLTAVGIGSDEVRRLLDNDQIADELVVSLLLAILAVAASAVAIMVKPEHLGRQTLSLSLGAALFITGMILSLDAARHAGDVAGAPVFESVSVTSSDDRQVLELHIVGQSFDTKQFVTLQVAAGPEIVYESSVAPDSNGSIDQLVSIPLAEIAERQVLRARAWTRKGGDTSTTNGATSGSDSRTDSEAGTNAQSCIAINDPLVACANVALEPTASAG
jgi:hypothetical protein